MPTTFVVAGFGILLLGAFLGGDGLDIAYGVKVAKSGSVYVCGATTSTNLPSKTGTLNANLFAKTDAFVAKFTNFNLEQLTYLGTDKDDFADFID